MKEVLQDTRTLIIEELTSLAQVNAVRRQWSELCSASPLATPFQSPAWVLPWWKHLGEGELLLLAIRDPGKLVGIAPFVFVEKPGFGRRLLLVGSGVTDYMDILVDEPSAKEALLATVAYLEARAGDCVEWDFQQLRASSPLLNMAPPLEWRSQLTVQEVCPALPLPAAPAHLGRVVPKHMLEKLAYYRRRLQTLHPARIELADSKSLEELLENFLVLHRQRWAAQGQPGMLAGEALESFHRDVATACLASGSLRLFGLRINGRIEATLYALADNRRIYFYLSGFNPELAAFSPGTLLIGHAIEQAIAEGATHFDFLRGREAYKYMWGARGQLNYRKRFIPLAEANAFDLSPLPEATQDTA
jgi:CelD/BcsL family acetyltransferase involved in cellulose biosynthesis